MSTNFWRSDLNESKRNRAMTLGALGRLAMLLALACLPAAGQQTTGSLVGTVKDQQGAVVNSATVKATNLDTGFSRSGAGKRLWRVPHRLPSRGQVLRRGDGSQL